MISNSGRACSLTFITALLLSILLQGCGTSGDQTTNPPASEHPDSMATSNPDSNSGTSPDTTIPPTPIEVEPLSEYEQTFLDSGLVDIREYDPAILVDLKYSSTDNFLGVDIYGSLEKCYLRPEAAAKLKKARILLQDSFPELTLLVFDGARPRRVQAEMWRILDVPFKRNYLAPPWEGSVHNYGCAVDLSLATLAGDTLDMGTSFDFFGPLAQPQKEASMLKAKKLSPEQLRNRKLLRRVMKAAGFYDIRTEWWHFNAFPSKTVKKKFGIIE